MLWTVRISVLLYGCVLGVLLVDRAGLAWMRSARVLWTAGCGLLAVHVLLAFHTAHGWSHADTVRHTADRTAALAGVRSGAGVYLNYLFVGVWAADAAYWWRAGHARYRTRRRAVTVAVHGFLFFIVFNAAVVFANGTTRYAGAAATAALAAVLVIGRVWSRPGTRGVQRGRHK